MSTNDDNEVVNRNISIRKLAILGLLAVSILIAGSVLQQRMLKAEVEDEGEDKAIKVTEGSPSIGIPVLSSAPGMKLKEFDNAVFRLAESFNERLLLLPNGGICLQFKETNSIFAIGANDLVDGETLTLTPLRGGNSRSLPVYKFDPLFSLALLKPVDSSTDIKISSVEQRPGESLIGIQLSPNRAIWITKLISSAEDVVDQRWYEKLIVRDPIPAGFSGILIDSEARLAGVVHNERIYSRRYINNWIRQAGQENFTGFPALPAKFNQLDSSLQKYLNLTGLNVRGTSAPEIFQPGDILQQINDRSINTPIELAKALMGFTIDQTVNVRLLRNGQVIEQSVKLIDSRANISQPQLSPIKLTDYLNQQLANRGRLVLVNININNPLHQLGLRTADEIISLNYQQPRNITDLKLLIKSTEKPLLACISRESQMRWIAIPRQILIVE